MQIRSKFPLDNLQLDTDYQLQAIITRGYYLGTQSNSPNIINLLLLRKFITKLSV